jgi:hypothetical protein
MDRKKKAASSQQATYATMGVCKNFQREKLFTEEKRDFANW